MDSDGNITYQHDTTPVRQVVSEETSAHVRECLEYVVSDGTGRNGQVKGYRVGGKTGTADKGQTGDRPGGRSPGHHPGDHGHPQPQRRHLRVRRQHGGPRQQQDHGGYLALSGH